MKYFIIGLHSSGKQEVVDHLEDMGVKCGKIFSNIDESSSDIYNSYNYELYTNDDINTIFENDAYIFIQEVPYTSLNFNANRCYEGLSKYTFDENQVFILSPDQFLAISPNTIKDDVCIIWMDSTKSRRLGRYGLEKRSYNFMQRESHEKKDINTFVKSIYTFKNSPMIYFMDEEPSRVAAVIYTVINWPDSLKVFVEKFN